MNLTRKMIILICMAFMGLQTIQADSKLVLESLILNHIRLSNRLQSRNAIETSVMGATNITTNRTDDYEVILDDLHTRVAGAFSNIQFAADIAILTTQTVKTAKLCEDAIDKAIDISLKHPGILIQATQALNETGMYIKSMYKLLAMVVTGGTGLVLANNEDRTQFCFMIRTKLMCIQSIMNNLIQLTEVIKFNDLYNKENGNLDVLKGSRMKQAKERALKSLSKAEKKL